tara:strand:- start:3759 stop:4946 length:1188 start_codon:yes stop_codon:yes gene_type:complete
VLIKNWKFSNKFFFIFIIFLFFLTNKNLYASKEPIIRVLIAKEKNLRIRSNGRIPFVLKNKDFSNKNVRGITIRQAANSTKLYFDSNKSKIYEIKGNNRLIIKSFDKKGIWVGSKRYSGLLNIINLDKEILVVNVLGIENYLGSVVGSEMPHKWPLEALKAQAIASRTYALKKTGNNIYDIDSTQKDQVYNGLESKTFKTSKAVKLTRSLVITNKNKLINALFHSSSAGMTENSENVWKNKYPYLVSVKDFDQKNPKLYWKKSFKFQELEKLFPEIGGIKDIKILEITKTGRIRSLKLIGKNGSKNLSGTNLREKLGLKSTLFRFKFIANKNQKEKSINSTQDFSLSIYGMGAGHGVGMSQWGARYMASRGYKAVDILKYFYRGVQIKPFKNIYK